MTLIFANQAFTSTGKRSEISALANALAAAILQSYPERFK